MAKERWERAFPSPLKICGFLKWEYPARFSMEKAEFDQLMIERRNAVNKAKSECPYLKLRDDFFSRFILDKTLKPSDGELVVDNSWTILFDESAGETVRAMCGHLARFFTQCMKVDINLGNKIKANIIYVGETGGGRENTPDSFTICAAKDRIEILGFDISGARNGVVRFIELIGLRRAPFVELGETVFIPRIKNKYLSLGGVENDIFYGANMVNIGGTDILYLSKSDIIPEIKHLQNGAVLDNIRKNAELARKYGLKMYASLANFHRFKKDDPVFAEHPDMLGTQTWNADGDYTLCTEHPLVQAYYEDCITELYKAVPDLSGTLSIIGGESFYHCFMRPYGKTRGHTNCPRCEKLGAERVVSNLCNLIVKTARRFNPEAEFIAWPYSAAYVWSEDFAQIGFMKLLDEGVAVMTEMEKDSVLVKPGGINKLQWDYSIDEIGPSKRPARQLEESRRTGVPVYSLTMAEMSFESSLSAFIPAHDRWAARSEAIAGSGFKGIFMWNMAPVSGATTGELYQFKWYEPAMDTDELLTKLASRVCGSDAAGTHLRTAWRYVSDSFEYIPVMDAYYTGPQYLGAAHPIVINYETEIPDVFKGFHLYQGEATPEMGRTLLPTYRITPAEIPGFNEQNNPQNVYLFEAYYRTAENFMKKAVCEVEKAEKLISEDNRIIFEAETFPVRWLYHQHRTSANHCAAYRLVKEINGLCEKGDKTEANKLLEQLTVLLYDEKENVKEATPISKKDARIETLHRGDHSFSKLGDMMDAKIDLLEQQIKVEIPKLKDKIENS